MKRKVSFTVLFFVLIFFISSCASNSNAEKNSLISENPTDNVSQTPTMIETDLTKSTEIQSSSSTSQNLSSQATTMPQKITADMYVNNLINNMSLKQQIEQMFFIDLKQPDGTCYYNPYGGVKNYVDNTQAGGYILFSGNITTVNQTKSFVDVIDNTSLLKPFIGIDEEGGRVSRLNSSGLDGYKLTPACGIIGASNNTSKAYDAAKYIGGALKSLDINVDFAPDADVLTNPNNTVIGDRSFGSSPDVVSNMVSAFQKGLHDNKIMSSPKHFPGHGGTSGDSHLGYVSVNYDLKHLNSIEYKPFERAISDDCEFVLVGHICNPTVDKSGNPASLSKYFVTDTLRNQLKFNGIIITDAMNMGAIADEYTSENAAVKAIEAGDDMIMMPQDYNSAINGVIKAVNNGIISKSQIRNSLFRILMTKVNKGIIKIN
ncbi:MAG: glycoside hydrolase family 3 protein [Bacillota bacterium]|nr:glycoside hydrolase family 3 protein [Bacillota bacterium]